MQIQVSGINLMDDESVKNAYIYFYIAIEENTYFEERNPIVKVFNTSMIEFIRGELQIRDINISPLITRAITIISINKKVK